MEEYFDEIPKYRKRKKKTVKKSDHKHKYDKEVLIETNNMLGKYYYWATICSICGKIGKAKYIETQNIKGEKTQRFLRQEEILKKYKNLPIIKK